MGFPRTPEFDRIIAGAATELSQRGIPFMIIGGQAVLLHGAPRLTEDIDITLGVPPDRVHDVLDACDALGLQALPEDPSAFARRTFVLPAADPETRVRVDFVFSTTEYERQAIERSVEVDVAGVKVRYASAEDLVLHKLFAGRTRDLEDARSVVVRRAGALDWAYIQRWAEEFSVVEGRENLPLLVRGLAGGADADPAPATPP
jgi:predicted nucleotidyltransferase